MSQVEVDPRREIASTPAEISKTSPVTMSKPGLRKYASSSNLPRILNGLGIAIVSTSKGLMTGKQAKQLNVGGEVVCYVY